MRQTTADMIGCKFHRLTVLSLGDKSSGGILKVLCKCDCGKERECAAADLRRGHTKSCGCFQKDTVRMTMTTHGATIGYKSIPEYRIWSSAKERCTNPSSARYKDYGGRGIVMCKKWLTSFENFYSDLGPRPSRSHTLDRKNNNKGYSKSNCRWATRSEQANNTRVNRMVVFNNKEQTLMEWSIELGFEYKVVGARLRLGWSVQEAFCTPVSRHNKIASIRRKKN